MDCAADMEFVTRNCNFGGNGHNTVLIRDNVFVLFGIFVTWGMINLVDRLRQATQEENFPRA
jgi:hypothetical protein